MSACQQITCSGSWALLCLVFTLCRVKIIWFFLSCQIWHKAYNKCHETTADVKVSEMCIKMSLQVASSLQYLKQTKMLHLVMKIAIFLNFVMNYFSTCQFCIILLIFDCLRFFFKINVLFRFVLFVISQKKQIKDSGLWVRF